MTERKYKIVTPHSDENPELDPDNTAGGPLCTYSKEGTAVSDLYKKDRNPLHYQPREGENVIDEQIYIPDVE